MWLHLDRQEGQKCRNLAEEVFTPLITWQMLRPKVPLGAFLDEVMGTGRSSQALHTPLSYFLQQPEDPEAVGACDCDRQLLKKEPRFPLTESLT